MVHETGIARATDEKPDTGLFGPDSISWRVHAEPILWIAALRALFLQMLHPRAIAGVVQNSSFKDDPWGRLYRTASFFGVVIFGSTADAETAGARVRGIHRRMRATDPDTGVEFRVDEPELLRWIHVTAVESFCSVAQRAGLGLTPTEVDQYYQEQLEVARLVGLDPATVPTTTADIEAYYDEMRPKLRVSADAWETARYLTFPKLPWGLGRTPVRPMWIGVIGYGVSLMPRWARRMYKLPGLPTTDLSASLTARGLRLALRSLPASVYEGPIYAAAMERAGRRAYTSGRYSRSSAAHGS
jgi:uncharacterized protein (DUF2236 family)